MIYYLRGCPISRPFTGLELIANGHDKKHFELIKTLFYLLNSTNPQ